MQAYLTLALLCLLVASTYAQLNSTSTTFPDGTSSIGNASTTSSTPSPMSSSSFVNSNAAAGQLSMSVFGLLVAAGVAVVRM
ncbi:hypothetical protein B0A55_06519 [Friedmanniomyces simplex]|uniref:REJ domain-containing protein n=1 Tax=Friedmanniomyces simplex TaxID=329884 RepID=A0A4U0X9Q6_9PEZI|nr:hypothetical protein B0A55_06519 [Friedmanniomyces simplex]